MIILLHPLLALVETVKEYEELARRASHHREFTACGRWCEGTRPPKTECEAHDGQDNTDLVHMTWLGGLTIIGKTPCPKELVSAIYAMKIEET